MCVIIMPDDAPPPPGHEEVYIDLDETGDDFFHQFSFALTAYSGGDCDADKEVLTDAWNCLSNAPPPTSLSIGVGVAIASQLASNIGNDAHDCIRGTIEAPVERFLDYISHVLNERNPHCVDAHAVMNYLMTESQRVDDNGFVTPLIEMDDDMADSDSNSDGNAGSSDDASGDDA